MADEVRRRMEMQAALKQIKTVQKRHSRNRNRIWRLDVSLPRLAAQGALCFAVGVLVGLGAFVLFRIVFV